MQAWIDLEGFCQGKRTFVCESVSALGENKWISTLSKNGIGLMAHQFKPLQRAIDMKRFCKCKCTLIRYSVVNLLIVTPFHVSMWKNWVATELPDLAAAGRNLLLVLLLKLELPYRWSHFRPVQQLFEVPRVISGFYLIVKNTHQVQLLQPTKLPSTQSLSELFQIVLSEAFCSQS